MEVGAMTIRTTRCASVLVGVLALLAAACAPADETAEEFEPGPLGAVTVGPDEPIKIASIQAVTGDTASLGIDQVRAIEIAMADMGGELLGHPIELVDLDDGCAAEQGTTAAQRVVADPQIVGVLGTSCSGAAVPAMEILAEEGITMISGSNTSPVLTSDLEGNQNPAHQEGYFRTAHNDITQGQAAATTPDVVFFPIFQPEADFIVRQAKEFSDLADTKKLFGADGLLSDTFIVIAETEGMYFSGPATPTGSAYEELVGKYEEEYGERPIQAFHAHSYDAANILFGAIEEVAVEEDDGTVHVDRQALMDALYELEGFEGLTGTLTCDEFGDCADVKIDIVQNTEGQTTIDQVRGNVLDSFEFGD